MTRSFRRAAASPVYRVRALASGVLIVGLLSAGCGPSSLLITPVSASRDLQEKEVLRQSVWASKKIALIDLDGVITNAAPSSLLGLDKAAGDKNVRAVVLRINSPGGGVTASDLMYGELKGFRERTGKPVIACMMDVAASGGYYLACAADRIIAHPTTVTGSIGVIMIAPDLTGTMQKLGIRTNVIKSGELKDAGSPFREMEPKDRAIFEGIVREMYARFLSVVAAGRPGLSEEKLREVADGRVYTAQQALELGFIDQIGTLHDAIAAARTAAGMDDIKIVVVEYARDLQHRPNVYAESPGIPAQVNLFNLQLPTWLAGPSPQFLYLWAPGW
jgi:protease-4